MRNRLLGLLATSVIVFAACQGAQTTPSASTAPASQPPASAGPPSATPAPTPVDYDQLLYGYQYDPSPGTPGGKVIVSDWQAANQLNYYYSNAFANSQVIAATMRSLLVTSADGHWKPDLAAEPITFTNNVKADPAAQASRSIS
jgi:hypothetical protein